MTSYLRSVHLAPNKPVFDVSKLPVEDFAASLGLVALPKLSFSSKRSGTEVGQLLRTAGSLRKHHIKLGQPLARRQPSRQPHPACLLSFLASEDTCVTACQSQVTCVDELSRANPKPTNQVMTCNLRNACIAVLDHRARAGYWLIDEA